MERLISEETINFIKKIYQKPRLVNNPTCYIYDLNLIKKNIELLKKYAPSQIHLFYALKANTNRRIVTTIANNSFVKGLEIASFGELQKALKFYPANQIIYTGPGKTEYELASAVKNKIRLINVESIVEAIRINELAKKYKIKKVGILIRINLNYCILDAQEFMSGQSTKMGIDEDQVEEAIKQIKALDRIKIEGVHVFAAGGVLNYQNLIKSVEYIFNLVKKLEANNTKINIIDVGGGLGIDYSNQNQTFAVDKYFSELSKLITEYNFNDKKIIMELGTYIVGNAGYYTAKIIDIKEVKGKKHIIIAGGVNHMGLPLEMRRKHPVHIISCANKKYYSNQPKVINELADISGPLCMVSDKLSWDDHIDEANIGDIVLYRQAGAYCYEEGMHSFLSHPKPSIHFINK